MSESTVFILDDNQEFRESTAFLLEAMGYRVHHYESHIDLLAQLAKTDKSEPACLLLDIRMPKISGLDVHDLMNDQKMDIPVIYMTAHGDVPLAVSAMKKGALTFLEKPLDDDALENALGQALSDSIQGARKSFAERQSIEADMIAFNDMTKREHQVTQRIVNKMSNKEIAEDLNISMKTVELHRARAMKKLSARNTAHLVSIILSCKAEKA